jgi:DNA repair protein RecN (Recombination protein N)
MLKRLSINNYILIKNLEVEFAQGLSVITGETGAGKSILLGALGLILGERADIKTLLDKNKKCIIEAEFDVSQYDLKKLFSQHDLDYEPTAIFRREVNSEGKSRAFINDTPITLNVMKEFSVHLLDIHSQHQTITLKDSPFQIKILDSMGGNTLLFEGYSTLYAEFKTLEKKLNDLKQQESKSISESEYLQFLYNELEAAQLQSGEQEQLEQELKVLSNTEAIIQSIQGANHIISEGEINTLNLLNAASNNLQNVSGFHPSLETLYQRIQSCKIELKDIAAELNALERDFTLQPERMEIINDRLALYHKLQQKHRVNKGDELLQVKADIAEKLSGFESLSNDILQCEKQWNDKHKMLHIKAAELHENRKKAAVAIQKNIIALLKNVAIADAQFIIDITLLNELTPYGLNEITFLFSANKGVPPRELSKVASGGELSRLMLCIKYLIATKTALPTILLDEIDSGISGEVAHRVGNMIEELSKNRQVITITHLPQMASKGNAHYFVYKHLDNGMAQSKIKLLSKEERIVEIAKMLSGEAITETSLENARHLLLN